MVERQDIERVAAQTGTEPSKEEHFSDERRSE